MELSSQLVGMSIGDSEFADRLAAGQAAAKDGEMIYEEEPEWLSGHNKLQPPPVATQSEDVWGAEDNEELITKVKKDHPDLTSKTFRVKQLLTTKASIDQKAGVDSYDLLTEMHDSIDDMEDGEDKKNDTAMYNAIYTIYETARNNASLRNFMADLFAAQRQYYNDKEEKKTINAELKVLNDLYNEQEEKQMMEALANKRRAREATLQQKAEAKATKLAEAGKAVPAAKKQKN